MKIENFVKEEFLKYSVDEKYKQFIIKLCPTKKEVVGITIPFQRKIAKDIVKKFDLDEILVYMEVKPTDIFEEIMIKGFLIGYLKLDINKRLELLKNFIPYIDNWSICDSVCSTFKFINKNRKIVFDFLENYFKSEKEFYQRVAIVIGMDYFIDDEYIDRLFEMYKKVNPQAYYSKMALAWGISKIYFYYEEKTIKFIKEANLDKFTHNKAIQKILESLKIKESQKEILKEMKIK